MIRKIIQDYMSIEELQRYTDDRNKCKVKCSCGHSMCIPSFLEYKICSYCGSKVYNKKRNFMINLQKALDKQCQN